MFKETFCTNKKPQISTNNFSAVGKLPITGNTQGLS